MKEYPRETVEFVQFGLVAADGEQTADFSYAITKVWARPVTWLPVNLSTGEPAFKIDGPTLGRGTYKVWVKFNDADEVPVIEAGKFRLT